MHILNDLVTALKARLPGIHLRTLEEPRALEALRQAANALSGQVVPRILWRWSSASGLWKLDLAEEPQDQPIQEPCGLDEALAQFKKSGENVILALLDPWEELSRGFFQRALREGLAHARGSGKALILVGRDWNIPHELQADLFVTTLALPTFLELREYIDSLCVLFAEKLAGKIRIETACIPDLARACQGLTLEEAKSIVALSLVRYHAVGPEAIRMAIREKRQIVRRTGILEYEEPGAGMAGVGGLEHLKTWVAKRAALFGEAARKAGIHAPKGLLLVGVPGTGKTLAARAIAGVWNLPLVRLDVGRLFGSLVGESEGNLRVALRTAEAIAPCVMMLDEVEKAFAQGGLDGGTSQRIFGGLLTWLQDKRADVFVVATANDLTKLPPEFLRKGRFDEIFAVDLPGQEARAEILRIHLGCAGHVLDVSELTDLASICQSYTGSELEAAVQAALIEAFHDGARKLTAADVAKALRTTVPLSKTMPEKIDALREWCRSGKAVAAGTTVEADRAKQQASVEV